MGRGWGQKDPASAGLTYGQSSLRLQQQRAAATARQGDALVSTSVPSTTLSFFPRSAVWPHPSSREGAHSPDWDPSFSPTRAWSPLLQRSYLVSLFEASLSSFSSRHLDLLNSCTVSLIHLLILEYWPPDVPTQAFPGEFSVVLSSMAIDIISSVSGVCSTSPFSSERVEFTCCSLFCEKREAPLPSPRLHAELGLGGPPNAS